MLQTQFNNGDLAIVQKTGLPIAELSHFSSQEIMSRGRASLANPNTTGWIGRLADSYFPNALDIVGLGVANRVDFNAVGAKPLVMANLANFTTYEFIGYADNYLRRDKLDSMVSQVFASDDRIDAVARSAADSGFDQSVFVANAVAPVSLAGNYSYTGAYSQVPGNGPHTDALGKSLKDIAKMIIAPTIGTRVFYTQASDFDTHGRQETFLGSSSATGRPSRTASTSRWPRSKGSSRTSRTPASGTPPRSCSSANSEGATSRTRPTARTTAMGSTPSSSAGP